MISNALYDSDSIVRLGGLEALEAFQPNVRFAIGQHLLDDKALFDREEDVREEEERRQEHREVEAEEIHARDTEREGDPDRGEEQTTERNRG